MTLTADEAAERLQGAGVPAGPSLHVGERYFHPHFSARNFHVDLDHPATGTDIVGGVAWKLNRTPGQLRRHAPLLGEHNDYVLRELLGLSDQEIARLREREVLS
jgi:crotonobetainyl-CoA:carnitine CoA-transferase CaiB-like acyl-CoA transferase